MVHGIHLFIQKQNNEQTSWEVFRITWNNNMLNQANLDDVSIDPEATSFYR
jgi:hypothetical protein